MATEISERRMTPTLDKLRAGQTARLLLSAAIITSLVIAFSPVGWRSTTTRITLTLLFAATLLFYLCRTTSYSGYWANRKLPFENPSLFSTFGVSATIGIGALMSLMVLYFIAPQELSRATLQGYPQPVPWIPSEIHFGDLAVILLQVGLVISGLSWAADIVYSKVKGRQG